MCQLDAQGRIVKMEETSVGEESTLTSIRTFTYDDKGHLTSIFKDFDEEEDGVTTSFTWEGDEIKGTSTSDGVIVVTYETSNAPAEAFFSLMGYDLFASCLCPQGCFGRLPAHLPSKRTLITYVAGVPLLTTHAEFKATVGENGHLAALEYVQDLPAEDSKYVLIWEEK